jgi:hypothetical protein
MNVPEVFVDYKSYDYLKPYLIKYQKTNPNYRIYKRKYETSYRELNKVAWNYKSWASVNKGNFRGDVFYIKHIDYLLKRFLK